ncbi:Ff.00g064830.m01.CDS01 [Fusarium sp. VM40]|nr:Ff.00g064830.m01.CDS01 [Fusarium sp. VM40]
MPRTSSPSGNSSSHAGSQPSYQSPQTLASPFANRKPPSSSPLSNKPIEVLQDLELRLDALLKRHESIQTDREEIYHFRQNAISLCSHIELLLDQACSSGAEDQVEHLQEWFNSTSMIVNFLAKIWIKLIYEDSRIKLDLGSAVLEAEEALKNIAG